MANTPNTSVKPALAKEMSNLLDDAGMVMLCGISDAIKIGHSSLMKMTRSQTPMISRLGKVLLETGNIYGALLLDEKWQSKKKDPRQVANEYAVRTRMREDEENPNAIMALSLEEIPARYLGGDEKVKADLHTAGYKLLHDYQDDCNKATYEARKKGKIDEDGFVDRRDKFPTSEVMRIAQSVEKFHAISDMPMDIALSVNNALHYPICAISNMASDGESPDLRQMAMKTLDRLSDQGYPIAQEYKLLALHRLAFNEKLSRTDRVNMYKAAACEYQKMKENPYVSPKVLDMYDFVAGDASRKKTYREKIHKSRKYGSDVIGFTSSERAPGMVLKDHNKTATGRIAKMINFLKRRKRGR
jgi:hypothetical protein